jgi:hypothetical protein
MINVTKIKKGIAVGTEIPERQRYGNVGQWAQDQLIENGYNINTGVGPDLAEMGVEVKTRKIESSSPHTVGSMRIQDIILTPYDQSNICDKFQKQYRVHYSDEGQVVTEERLYDLTDEYIQSKIRAAYEAGRKTIARNEEFGYHPPYVKGTSWGNFEIVESCTGYSFRIPHGAMKKIETASKNAGIFKRFFE